ncbi:hypothetical protein Goshw_008637 [Gossypium schwendimanii]|uniref:pectinesterase n=1 Tax=Gossypium schwendimanii TaxID=34291 RepID=A0A7J9KK74_GOSSC|nr:hypothetical protein [Gossypium schwendimanii]
MTGIGIGNVEVGALITIILIFAPTVSSQSSPEIPEDKSQVSAWFDANAMPASERTGSIDPVLAQAETEPTVVKVVQGGGGDFETITEAIESVPEGNDKRVIISIGPGSYKEKIKIERTKPFITFHGDPDGMPTLTFDGTARDYGTVDSASLIVESDFFMAVNLIIENSAPRPDGKTEGAQAVALRISGDEAAFYTCKIIVKYAKLNNTCDFFPSITPYHNLIMQNTELYVDGDTGLTVITAQARESQEENTGYSFVHCTITGTAQGAYLGRAWKTSPKVVYAYTDMSEVINPEGWSHNLRPERAQTVFYGEYKNTGPGADQARRVPFAAQLTENVAQEFLNLGFIEGSRWLLPPPNI